MLLLHIDKKRGIYILILSLQSDRCLSFLLHIAGKPLSYASSRLRGIVIFFWDSLLKNQRLVVCWVSISKPWCSNFIILLHIALSSNLGIRTFEEICGTLNPETPKSINDILLHFAFPAELRGNLVDIFILYNIPAGIVARTENVQPHPAWP